MTCKLLEISSGKDLPPKRFEITEVEANIFMLKTKESKTELVETLDKWLQSNYSLRESGYGEMLYDRSSSMRQVLSDDVTPDFHEEMIEVADQADNLFIGGENKLWQWSVSQKKVTKDYGEIMAGRILSMVQTSNKKYLFVSDPFGC
jgi:WD40 repeat protein